MSILCFTLLLLLSLAGFSSAGELSPFRSDGCSNFPDGPPNEPDRWRDRCFKHDKGCWLGGTYTERQEADSQLQSCLAEVENKLLADLMWAGVIEGPVVGKTVQRKIQLSFKRWHQESGLGLAEISRVLSLSIDAPQA